MLKNRGPALALGTLFVVAVYGVSLSWLPQQDTHTIDKGNNSAHNCPSRVTVPESAEKRIADYTFWLSAFTLALVVVSAFQYFFLLRADKTARITADAAKRSADAAVAAERGRFFVVVGPHNFHKVVALSRQWPASPSMPIIDRRLLITYGFKNYGKTPAVIREISHGIAISREPPDPVYTLSNLIPQETVIAPSGTTDEQTCIFDTNLETVKDAMPLSTGEAYIWFYGRIDYKDIFGDMNQTHRFFFRYIDTGKGFRFQPYDYKHYNKST
jgi:hypothetical protein